MWQLSFGALGLALVLGACGGREPAGPAWPKAATTDEDGGESLAPRSKLAAVEKPDAKDEDAKDGAEAKSAEATEPEAEAEAEASTEVSEELMITVEEEVINLDDIVIEIEDE